jgi:PTH1 family peptidyl-tRNA hydrolase
VLSTFRPDEREIVERAIERAADAVEVFVESGIETAMNKFNAKEDTETGKPEV